MCRHPNTSPRSPTYFRALWHWPLIFWTQIHSHTSATEGLRIYRIWLLSFRNTHRRTDEWTNRRTDSMPLSQNSVERWHMGHGRRRGGNADHVTLGLVYPVPWFLDSGLIGLAHLVSWLRIRYGYFSVEPSVPRDTGYVLPGVCFNNSNFAGSAALAEVYALDWVSFKFKV